MPMLHGDKRPMRLRDMLRQVLRVQEQTPINKAQTPKVRNIELGRLKTLYVQENKM